MLDYNNFENGWGVWNDGGSDCRRNRRDAPYALDTYCVRLRDDSRTSVMTTDPLNLAGYNQLQISFSYFPLSMDNSTEGFLLQLSTGGNNFVTVEEWNRSDEFRNNRRYYETVEIAGPFSSDTRLRFRCDASGNSDWVYIDEVQISACGRTSGISSPDISQQIKDTPAPAQKPPVGLAEVNLPSMQLFPNPAYDELTVSFSSPKSGRVDLSLRDVTGKVLYRTVLQGVRGKQQTKINVSGLISGFYFIQLNIEEEQVIDKFVVTR